MNQKNIILSIIIIIASLIASCDKSNPEISNLNHNKLLILGHQGMGDFFHYPGNSFISIETVINIGADGSEVDLQLTKDSVIVLFHNPLLESTTTGKGQIKDLTWNEISKIRYKNTNIPLCKLEDVLSAFSHDLPSYFSLDCKRGSSYNTDTEYAWRLLHAIKRLSDKYGMEDYLILEGTFDFLKKAKSIGLKSKLMVQVNSLTDKIEDVKKEGFFGFGFGSGITKEEIKLAHDNGLFVMLWSIKSEVDINTTIKKNPDIIQTDKPINTLILFDRFDYTYRIP